MPIVRDMLDTDYHAHSAFGNSELTLIRDRSPAHYMAAKLARDDEVTTAAKLDGRALHCAILEPGRFMARYAVTPEGAPRDLRHFRKAKDKSQATLDSIAWWDDFDLQHQGKILLSKDSYDLKMRTSEIIRNHPDLRPYFDAPGGESELSVFANDPETGVGVKCRPDYRVTIGGFRIALDPKSTIDPRKEAFRKAAYSYGYFQQAPYYTDVSEWAGDKIDLFLFIAFEKVAPFGVKVYELSADDMEYGRRQYRAGLNIAAECVRTDSWPNYNSGIEVLERPVWVKE